MKGLLLLIDVGGALSLAVVCTGVYFVFGKGWALIVAGTLPLALYVWHFSRFLRSAGPAPRRSRS